MNSDPLRVFGRNLYRLRKEHRLTQEELAELAETSAHHISKMENGQSEPGYHLLRRLRRALECPWAELMGEDDPEPVVRVLRRNRQDNNRRSRP